VDNCRVPSLSGEDMFQTYVSVNDLSGCQPSDACCGCLPRTEVCTVGIWERLGAPDGPASDVRPALKGTGGPGVTHVESLFTADIRQYHARSLAAANGVGVIVAV
jgi:hypothetical protein